MSGILHASMNILRERQRTVLRQVNDGSPCFV